jgi:FkbM family methyltransferase
MKAAQRARRVEARDGRGGYELILPNAETDYLQKLIAESGAPYEEEMLQDMAARLQPGELVLDIGANVGNHALYLAALADARIVAFEPNSVLAELIRESAALNGLKRSVDVRSCGLGRKLATACFAQSRPDNLGAQSLVVGDGDIQILPLDTLDLPGAVRMIKVDVEGMELDVLDGATQVIMRDRPLLYIESQDETGFRRLARWMQRHDYGYWETFNATPTHLYLPLEECRTDERFERLMTREVVQEYRYHVLLRRARRFQAAAEARAKELESQVLGGRGQQGTNDGAVRELETILDAKLSSLSDSWNGQALRREEVHALEVARLEDVIARVEGLARGREDQLRCDLEALHEAKAEQARLEVEQRGRQIRHLRNDARRLQAYVAELEQSTAFQLGLALVRAMTSLRGAVRLPFALARLATRGFTRRMSRSRDASRTGASAGLPDNLAPDLLAWIATQPKTTDVVAVLYADINLNIVDGSSVWLSSVASILCTRGPCILVSKAPVTTPVVLSNVRHAENLLILDPSVFPEVALFSVEDAIRVVRELDGVIPGLRRVVVRGLQASTMILSDRQFDGRAAVYLTDFYSVLGNERMSSEEQIGKVRACTSRAAAVLVQTPEIGRELERIAGEFPMVPLPPVVPTDMPAVVARLGADDGIVRIGYAGKVNSRWGVVELLEWAERARAEGRRIELHIVANKISNGPEPGYENLRTEVLDRMQRIGAHYYADFNRQAAMGLMSRMDFVWCYRPSRLEDNTIELSTKLVEMVSLGARCFCYPSDVNRNVLGQEYPFYIRGYDDFISVLRAQPWPTVPAELPERILAHHGFDAVVERVGEQLLPTPCVQAREAALVTGHDMKFIDSFVSRAKANGYLIHRDVWEWGRSRNETASSALQDRSSTVFCEWGLANAVWASRTLPKGKRLLIRIHAQEVRERARRFGKEIDPARVDAFIFVSDTIRQKALELWGWPEEKTFVVPNYVLDGEYTPEGRLPHEGLVLGMVGIVPTLKRFDRALDLLSTLVGRGVDVTLEVKGHRPETLEFMQAPGRRDELDFYYAQYERIEQDPRLRGRVKFTPWGNDVARWYKGVDVVLSSSETESFHYALADGVLSGCFPVIWPWPGAGEVYSADWVIDGVEQACKRVLEFFALPAEEREAVANANRDLVVSRYGFSKVAPELLKLLRG